MSQTLFFDRYIKLGESPAFVRIPKFLRVNTLRITENVLIPRLSGIGIEVRKVPWLNHGFEITKARFSPGASIESLLGYFYIQEAAAELPAEILNPKQNSMVADMCASPGGKTTQLAQIMKNTGTIIALDKSDRLDSLRNNLERMGISNTIILKKDARFLPDLHLQFDSILLDAPCSGNFVTDPAWFSKRRLQDVTSHEAEQKELVKSAWRCLKPGGILVYSTCSLEPEENEEVINYAKNKFDDLIIEPINIDPSCNASPGLTNVFGKELSGEIKNCLRFWPWKTNTEGFFIAKLRKKVKEGEEV